MRLAAIGLLVLLSACASFPRGAGLQREVLSQQTETDTDGTVTENFAVMQVTRDRLAAYDTWPAVGEPALSWIDRVDQPDGRVVTVGDTITLNLWSLEENGLLTAPGQRQVSLPAVPVMSDGTVFLPYVGELRVSGMSERRAREVIEEAYLSVAPSVQVQIALTAGRQSSVSVVSGAVSPGLYPLADRDMTVLELLAVAGGVAPALVNPQIRLQRGSHLYGISMERLLADPSRNTTLQGGDRVHIEADRRYFLSLGAVGRETQIPFGRDRVSALDALSLIGGLSDTRANARGILILRRYPPEAVRADGTGPLHERMIFTLDLTSADGLFSAGEFWIMPGDLVYVTESPLGPASTLLGLAASAFGLANTATATLERVE